ncbi:MAG: hypothetical protein MUP98_14365 [Candidatus Aminicenantes bacterium]|nr:hypothetical protein [Candidatus Aminicenantes bacterium]
MLIGKSPFKGWHEQATFHAILNKEQDVDCILEGTIRWSQTPDGLERVKIIDQ